MLADALSQLSIGSVTNGQDNNKELVCDVHNNWVFSWSILMMVV